MKILLIGHGRMGHLMERTALAQGDQLGGIVDVGNLGDLETIGRVADVAIDFSAPAALPAVARYVRQTGTPLLSGVTGLSEAELEIFTDLGRCAPVIHSANYSLGVAVFRRALAGTHTVSFFGPDEVLEITHRASSRQIFVNGALHAARRLIHMPKGRYALEDILFGGTKA